jgi:hypothetical protein
MFSRMKMAKNVMPERFNRASIDCARGIMIRDIKTAVFVASLIVPVLACNKLHAQARLTGESLCLFTSSEERMHTISADTSLVRKTFVHALAIYVAFPDQPAQRLPEVASRLEAELPHFIRCMSEGRQTLVLETALRPTPFDSLCYVADSSMSYYQSRIIEPPPKALGLEVLTDEILDKVDADDPGFVSRYDVVFFNVLGNFLSGADGFAFLVRSGVWEKRYTGVGTTNDLTDPQVFLGIVGHEYGHLLGAQHPPHFFEKSFGDYELMDQNLHRLAPYSVQNLMNIGWIAPERVQAVKDTLYNVALEDVRRGGKVLLIEANREQYFLIANHQGSDYDSVYHGRGLLVWHQMGKTAERKAYSVWDLESAAGLLREGHPDPIAGQDDFDRSRDSTGSAADFFHPQGAARFDANTNPNTNLYDEPIHNDSWRVQSRPSGVALTNLRQEGSTIYLDVFVPEFPPRILLVKGPNAVEEPNTFFAVDIWTASTGFELTAEVLYRYHGETGFTSAKAKRLDTDRFAAEIPLQKAGTIVHYYVRVENAKGREEFFPAAAPDSLLRFIIKPFLSNMITLAPRTVELAPGESLTAPLLIGNSSDLSLQLQMRTLLSETPGDYRAYDTSAVAHTLYAPKVFFDPQTTGNFGLYWEQAPGFYLRLPGYGNAVAKLHVTYDEQWIYLYFVMLQPRTIDHPFTLETFWRDSSFSQAAWVTATGAIPLSHATPAIPMRSDFLSDARGSLPRMLIKLSAPRLLGVPQRNLELRVRFWSDRYSRANWPSVAAPEKFGRIVWREDSPFFQLENFVEQLAPGERHTRSLRFHAPEPPWAGELSALLLVQSASPFGREYFIPLLLKVKDFRSRFDPPDTTSPPRDLVLDPKPNVEPRTTSSLPENFRIISSYPNPLRASSAQSRALRLRFFLPHMDVVETEVFDALGRRVAELGREEFPAGEHELLWNGKSSAGEHVLRGLYFIRLHSSTKTALAKILVI